MASTQPYDQWSKVDLISRIRFLESTLVATPALATSQPNQAIAAPQSSSSDEPVQHAPPSIGKRRKQPKPFNFGQYPKRKIALKFCYAGWEYNGLAYQTDPTPLPMVEAVLLKALGDCRLIDPDAGFDGCGWSRCGRTDKGVSAAGQVVALWVRSNLGVASKPPAESVNEGAPENVQGNAPTSPVEILEDTPAEEAKPELRYVRLLNSLLPRSIRILAWSPVDGSFDARFSCSFRHYKYFFGPHIPPYSTVHSTSDTTASLLDLDAMAEGASRLLGDHDFRNFCKIDPSKQVENYTRTISLAKISRVRPEASAGALHALDLKGNGFLYHQVRHIMAVLFLIGARLESPDIVDRLLDAEVVDRKPVYEMADGLPLTLWDCGYPEGTLRWTVDEEVGTAAPTMAQQQSSQNIFFDFELLSTQYAIKKTLLDHFAQGAAAFHLPPPVPDPSTLYRIPLGGGNLMQSARTTYMKLLDRPRGQRSEDLNERWRTGAGARRKERKEGKSS